MKRIIDFIVGCWVSMEISKQARDIELMKVILEGEKEIALLNRDIACIKATGKKYNDLVLFKNAQK
jgi:hypothetical protein